MAGKRELILASAEKLLKQRNYKEITVLDIVEDSKVNRNTFYYHFKDMPSLVETIARRNIDRQFEAMHAGIAEKLCAMAAFLYENRMSVLHVYGSADRVIFDKLFADVCEHMSEKILGCCPNLAAVNEAGGGRVLELLKCSIYGVASNWMLQGMTEQGLETIQQLCRDCEKFLK